MTQHPGNLSFVEKKLAVTLPSTLLGQSFGIGNFDGNVTTDEFVMSEINRAHTPLTEHLDYLVLSEPAAGKIFHLIRLVNGLSQYPIAWLESECP